MFPMLAQGLEPQPLPLKCIGTEVHKRFKVPPHIVQLGTCELTASTSSVLKLHDSHLKSYLGIIVFVNPVH